MRVMWYITCLSAIFLLPPPYSFHLSVSDSQFWMPYLRNYCMHLHQTKFVWGGLKHWFAISHHLPICHSMDHSRANFTIIVITNNSLAKYSLPWIYPFTQYPSACCMLSSLVCNISNEWHAFALQYDTILKPCQLQKLLLPKSIKLALFFTSTLIYFLESCIVHKDRLS